MSAVVNHATGQARSLERVPESPAPLTERDVQEPSTLVRLIAGLIRDVDKLRGKWKPRHVDFEAVTLEATGTVPVRLPHDFDGAVRFWIVDWNGASAHNLRKDAATTDRVLVLTSTSAGTATIRVEEAG